MYSTGVFATATAAAIAVAVAVAAMIKPQKNCCQNNRFA